MRRRPHVLLTREQVVSAVALLSGEPTVVIDIETTRQAPRWNELLWVGLGADDRTFLIPTGHPKGPLISPAHKVKKPACVAYPPPDPRGLTGLGRPSMRMVDVPIPAVYAKPPKQLYPDELCQIIKPLLFSDTTKLGHSVKFDMQSLAKYYDDEIPPGPYHDTILIRHVLNENLQNYGLKELTRDWFGPELRKLGVDPRQWYPEMGKAGVENYAMDEAARYLTKDIRYCWFQFARFFPLLSSRGLLPVYELEMKLYPLLMQMEYDGFQIDPSVLDTVREGLESEIDRIEQAAYKRADGQFPLSNLTAKRWVLFGHGDPVFATNNSSKKLKTEGLKPLTLTPKEHLPQLNKATLEHYANRNEMAELFKDWSAYEKLRGTFVEGLDQIVYVNPDTGVPTVHTSFKQHGTVTGRLSAEKPNLQQLPKGPLIRQLFIAGPGHLLIVADYDQVELRCVGYLCRDPAMLQVFLNGEDIHRSAAAAMYLVGLDKVTEAQRHVGKTQNFATLYGAGPDRIAKVAGCSKATAKLLISGYYDKFAGLEPWKQRLLKEAGRSGDRANPIGSPPYVTIPPYGRKRRLPDLYRFSEDDKWMRFKAERQAVNAVVQGFASNITKMAMLDLAPKLAPYPAQMVVQVHDEVVIRVREDCVDEVLPLVRATMSNVVGNDGRPILGNVPLVVSADVGYNWASAKGK